nr:Chain d5, Phycobilisome 27.9 kDa linker polypeptide, phycoerythrin-associated, rod [Porphyridium purpureum]7Y4L_dJ Chain dJ, Phycobilisome 27.9 kDa linker polypeptide, phycoerythrin-associated, rod [Porphyridium purpureum]
MAFVTGGVGAVVRPGTAVSRGVVCARQQARPRAAALQMGVSDVSITLSGVAASQPVSAPAKMSLEDRQLLVLQAIKQVFGNAYVMEEERASFAKQESMFLSGELSVREFVRELALSDTYRRRFFEPCGPYRFVELNMKHLLGRGPISQAEVSQHVQCYVNNGYEAEISSYVDSDEYYERFGEDTVPYEQFRGTYMTAEDFNRMVSMYGAPGQSDKSLTSRARSTGVANSNKVLSLEGAGRSSKTVGRVATNTASSLTSVKSGIPPRPDIDQPRGQSSKRLVGRRLEIVPGSYMYLSPAEAAEYRAQQAAVSQVSAAFSADVQSKMAQVSKLKR